jgi:endonuclease/exonuclease/phosphatase family metal-dependent hydrolase
MLGVVSAMGLGAAAEVQLTVMSFNLRHGKGLDGENIWPNRKDILVNAVKHYAPDILGVQECLDFQADYLAAALPDYHWFGIPREADGTGEMAAVFYRKAALLPIDAGNFWLSETPETPGSKSWKTMCTRICTWAAFWHPASGAHFRYYNTHFDHASEEARVGAANLLVARTGALPADTPTIITGDFNADAESSAAWTLFTDSGFKDAWLTAENHTGPEATFGGFKPPVNGVKSRIDWILTRGPITVQSCETVTYEENGRFPSDHYPVCAKLTIRP